MPFKIVRQDITKMEVDAIVNAANTDLLMGGGVCGAIFKAAGASELQEACNKLAPIKTGEAVITPGFDLPAKYVVHTAGPIYHQWTPKQSEQFLYSAYAESLKIALKNDCESIAFPLISSGIYGYPKKEALEVATRAIRDFLVDNEMDVYLAVFDSIAFTVSEELMGAVESYIDQNYVDERKDYRRTFANLPSEMFVKEDALEYMSAPPAAMKSQPLVEVIGNMDEPFNATLLKLIDAKGMTDVEVYKRANIDRKLFSKIRTGNGYMPSKRTIIALAIGLKLTLEETDDLLERAGYALSHSQIFDVIIEYFIVNGKYDILEINEVLFKYDQPLLGAN